MIQVINTDIMTKYQTLPMMIAEETGDEIEYVGVPTTDKVWHYYFLEGDSSIKPKTEIAMMWDNKIYQYEQFKDKFKVPRYKIYENVIQLIKDLPWLKKTYSHYMITEEYGVNGKNFMYVDGNAIPELIFQKYFEKGRLRVSEFIHNAVSISLHLIIANKDEFYASPVVEQHIEDMTLYRGGRYPYDIDIDCSVISNTLFESGYVGLAHVDLLVGDDIYFGEINPRIAGSTPYMSYCLEREYGINLPYLEYYAVQNNSLPNINTKRKCNISWDFKVKIGNQPDGNWISNLEVRKAFDKSGVYLIPYFSKTKYIRLRVKHDKTNNI